MRATINTELQTRIDKKMAPKQIRPYALERTHYIHPMILSATAVGNKLNSIAWRFRDGSARKYQFTYTRTLSWGNSDAARLL